MRQHRKNLGLFRYCPSTSPNLNLTEKAFCRRNSQIISICICVNVSAEEIWKVWAGGGGDVRMRV
jgi:hypothetical protein